MFSLLKTQFLVILMLVGVIFSQQFNVCVKDIKFIPKLRQINLQLIYFKNPKFLHIRVIELPNVENFESIIDFQNPYLFLSIDANLEVFRLKENKSIQYSQIISHQIDFSEITLPLWKNNFNLEFSINEKECSQMNQTVFDNMIDALLYADQHSNEVTISGQKVDDQMESKATLKLSLYKAKKEVKLF